MTWWLALLCVMVLAALLGAWSLRQARENGEVKDLHDAISDLERAVGAEILPILQRMNDRLARLRWRR